VSSHKAIAGWLARHKARTANTVVAKQAILTDNATKAMSFSGPRGVAVASEKVASSGRVWQ
jgi:hypothetical protein